MIARWMLVGSLALAGCKPSAASSVDASFGGEAAKLTYGIARVRSDGNISVIVSTHAQKCSVEKEPVPSEKRVAFAVARGPNGSWFVGGPTGIDVGFASGSDAMTIAPGHATTVEVEALSGGQELRGKLRVKWPSKAGAVFEANGSFVVEICGDSPRGTPPVFAAQPAQGTIAHAPFAVKQAIAWIAEEHGVRYVERLQLFPSADVPCAAAKLREVREPVVELSSIGGASQSHLLLGTAQPAVAAAWVNGAKGAREKQVIGGDGTRTAVRFDVLELTRGGKLRGAVLADEGAVSGTFEGKVCERGPSADVASSSDVTMDVEGTKQTLGYVTARATLGDLSLSFTDVDVGCRDEGFGAHLVVSVPTGPERRFFAGHHVRVGALLDGKKVFAGKYVGIPVELELSPFALAEGARIKGSLSFDAKAAPSGQPKLRHSGKGTFDVALCDDVHDAIARLRVHPADADTGDVKGSLGEIPFATESAVAYVTREDGVARIERIELFPTTETCATAAEQTGKRVRVRSEGARLPLLLGSPQPAYASIEDHSGTVAGGSFQRTWMWIDTAALVRGGHVAGRLYAANGDVPSASTPWKLSGRFDAVVCDVK